MLDQSRTALRFAAQFFAQMKSTRWPDVQLRTHVANIAEPLPLKEPYDVILLHYVLNELPFSAQRLLLSRAARLLNPNALLFLCEPLRHEAGDYMRGLREAAIKDFHLHIHAPCPHEMPCPLSTACHDLRTWRLPRSLQILNATLHRDLNHLAYAFLILSSAPPSTGTPNGPQSLEARVAGSIALQKGHAEFPACCSDGNVKHFQLLNREFDTAGRKWLRHLERGERLNLAEIQPLGDLRTHRAKIQLDSKKE
jgi:ribosomal protein RSM22 (predicted rRNA methylase)